MLLTEEQINKHVIFSKDNPALFPEHTFPRKYLCTKWLLQYTTGKKRKKTICYHVKLELDASFEGYVYEQHITDNFLEALQFNNMEEPFKLGMFLTDDADFKLIEIVAPSSIDQSNK